MMHSIWTAATGMQAQQMRIDAIANNLANVNTTAYKKSNVEFQDLLYQAVEAPGSAGAGIEVGLGVKPTAITKYHSQGNMQITNNPLDLAIDGQGFFQVSLGDAANTPAYTRDGSFKVDAQGRLTTSSGYLLFPNIQIPSGYTDIKIRDNGQIYGRQTTKGTQEDPLGTIEIFTFANPAGLEPIGNNLYTRNQASGDAQNHPPGEGGAGVLRQGAIEASNVELVTEMVMMIATQKAYDTASKAISTSDKMMDSTNQLVR